MQVTQLHTLLTKVVGEILGGSAVVAEDLSNVVDLGKEVFSAVSVDNYVKKLVNHIGKVAFTARAYAGGVPSVLMDSWEFGSVLEKISADLPAATENASWNLTDGQSYPQDVFHQPKVSAKFFNSKVTFEIPVSFTEIQVKESFSSAAQLNGFISMILTAVENSMTVQLDALIMRAINNMSAETLLSLATGNAGAKVIDYTKTGIRAINLLKLYNDQHGLTADKALKVANCMADPEFIRFATYTVSLTVDRMTKISKVFNGDGKERFTPPDALRVVLLSDFSKATNTYLRSNLQNEELVVLPQHDTVPYWQGSGEDYALSSIGIINVKTASGENVVIPKGQAVLIGAAFDKEAVGVSNLDRRVTTAQNAKGEFYTNFYKMDAGYYNDLGENYVVFFVGEAAAAGG